MAAVQSHLKKYRLEVGLTQEGLADRVGVTRQTINAIEAGKYEPSLSLAWHLARLFRVTIEDLFTF